MKKIGWKNLIILFLYFGLLVVGFLHIPILVACGVDVFALRGLMIFTVLPTVVVFSLPFCIYSTILYKRWLVLKKTKKEEGHGV